jgi:hypothetical protein
VSQRDYHEQNNVNDCQRSLLLGPLIKEKKRHNEDNKKEENECYALRPEVLLTSKKATQEQRRAEDCVGDA